MCDDEHTLNGKLAIHNNGTCEKLSRIIGQLAWELNYLNDKADILKAREQFRKRYGKSYL